MEKTENTGEERLNKSEHERMAEIENENQKLKYWKESEIKLWLPVIEYMQKHSELKLGESIVKRALDFLKERDQLEKNLKQERSAKEKPDKKWLKIRSTQEILDNRYAKIQALESELTELREALKELIPIAEDRLFSIPVTSLEGVQEIVDRAKKLIK